MTFMTFMTFRYRLQPTSQQERRLEEVQWRCRALYNTALERRGTWWRCGQGKASARFQQEAKLKDLWAAFPEDSSLHSHVLKDVLARLDRTHQAFFRHVLAGEQAGCPPFQGRGRCHSFTYQEYSNGTHPANGCLLLSRIGPLAIRWSHPLIGAIKTVTVSGEPDGWYVCFSCALAPTQPLPPIGRETGQDVGLKVFLVTAAGAAVTSPRHHRTVEKQQSKARKPLSRRKKRSKRWYKAARLVARHHQKVRRRGQDFHHQTALAELRACNTPYLEDLRVANLVRNRHLSKSDADAGRAQFRTTLAYKAVCAGKRVVLIEPASASQDCSDCGAGVEKSLSVRTHVCSACGFTAGRDRSAALNIMRAGQAHRGAVAVATVVERESIGH